MNLMGHIMSTVYMELLDAISSTKGSSDPRKRHYSTGKARPNTQGRNDLCRCGSGLKYKRCCGKE